MAAGDVQPPRESDFAVNNQEFAVVSQVDAWFSKRETEKRVEHGQFRPGLPQFPGHRNGGTVRADTVNKDPDLDPFPGRGAKGSNGPLSHRVLVEDISAHIDGVSGSPYGREHGGEGLIPLVKGDYPVARNEGAAGDAPGDPLHRRDAQRRPRGKEDRMGHPVFQASPVGTLPRYKGIGTFEPVDPENPVKQGPRKGDEDAYGHPHRRGPGIPFPEGRVTGGDGGDGEPEDDREDKKEFHEGDITSDHGRK